MMERRQALVPLLLVFTLGTSTYGKFKMYSCVDVVRKRGTSGSGFSRMRVTNPPGDTM